MRAPAACLHPGCPAPATRRGRCAAHQIQRVEGRPWRRLVAQVVARDDGICQLCGEPGGTTADHIIRASAGGATTLDNLRCAHVACNVRRA